MPEPEIELGPLALQSNADLYATDSTEHFDWRQAF